MALPPVITTMTKLERTGVTLAGLQKARVEFTRDAVILARNAFAEGHTVSQIARAAGVTRPTVYQWLKEEGK